jgi:hypothetical protein
MKTLTSHTFEARVASLAAVDEKHRDGVLRPLLGASDAEVFVPAIHVRGLVDDDLGALVRVTITVEPKPT